MSEASICPGCGLELPERDGPTHPYIGASAGCWALYGELLAAQYGSYDGSSHRLAVDAYAVQHPGGPERRAIQSVGLHLAALCLVLEQGVNPAKITELMRLLLAREARFEWLEPPERVGRPPRNGAELGQSLSKRPASMSQDDTQAGR